MKTFCLGLSTLIPVHAYSNMFEKTCEDIGARTVKKQLVIATHQGSMKIGEPQDFCELSKSHMTSLILASSLLSPTPNLAATAYRIGPKPILDGMGERGDRVYCRLLGGSYRLGNAVVGGWVDVDDPNCGQSGMCVFADGSMISTWTLFYKRDNPTTSPRPDFEPYFQNQIIDKHLW